MESFEFDELDEPMAFDGPRKRGPDDTQTLRYRRCDVCGVPLFCDEQDEPPRICSTCDVKMASAIVDLLMKGHRITKRWSKADG